MGGEQWGEAAITPARALVAELQCVPPPRVLAGRRGVAGPSPREVMGRLLRIQGLSVLGASLEPRGLVMQVRPRQRRPRCGKIFDRFHVRKLANEALDTVRRQEVREHAGSEEGKALKQSRWALPKNPWNLTVRQGETLNQLKKTNQTLYRAYLLKESLARGMDYVRPKRAEEHLDKWCQWASHSRLAPFAKLAKTVKRHEDDILAYVETGPGNGVVEGINNKIRAIIRRAYGFRNPKALMAMIPLCRGGMELTPPLPAGA